MERVAKWPLLQKLQSETGLASIDICIASKLLQKHSGASENAAAFLCLLVSAARQGHLCLRVSEDKIVPSAIDLFEDALLAQSLDKMALQGVKDLPEDLINSDLHDTFLPLCRHGQHFYLHKNWFFEGHFTSHVMRLNTQPLKQNVAPIPLDHNLNQQQKIAVEMALLHCFSIITGGPGTGKTFTAAQIVKALIANTDEHKRKDLRILLTAPTGKAAAHLEKNVRKLLAFDVELRAGTLHKLLSIRSSEDMMKPATALHADLLIIDEASMIDARLFSYCLSSIEEGTRVVLMGDKDQLPPVESGSLFADLVGIAEGSECIACTELKQSLRSDRKQILDFAITVNSGDMNGMLHILSKEEASLQRKEFFSATRSIKSSYEALWNHSKEYFVSFLDGQSNADELLQRFDRFRILSCTKKGPMGVDAINTFFASRTLSQAKIGESFVCPILITKNDYTLDLFNGEVGVLVQKKKKDKHLDSEDIAYFYDKSSSLVRKIPALMLSHFEYAYCLSVHKSQGSEYENIVILVPEGSEVFGKEVLYTAVTRAKSSVVINASDEILKNVVCRSSRKISGLHARLQLTGGNPCSGASQSVLF